MQKFISILIQGHILFIALSYNKFCRSGEYDIDIDVMSYFFDEKNNTFSPEGKIECLLLSICILVQGQIWFIALFYNKFCRPGFESASVRTFAHFEHLTL